MLQAATLSTRVTLCMSSDIPLKLEFKIGKIGSLRYYLAPKIEDDQNFDPIHRYMNLENKIYIVYFSIHFIQRNKLCYSKMEDSVVKKFSGCIPERKLRNVSWI